MARLMGKDVTVLTAGSSLLATYRRCAIEIERETYETTGALDTARTFAPGPYSWRVTFEAIKQSAAVFPVLLLAGGTAAFTCTEAATGKHYSGAIIFSAVSDDVASDPQLERVTAQGTGALSVT